MVFAAIATLVLLSLSWGQPWAAHITRSTSPRTLTTKYGELKGLVANLGIRGYNDVELYLGVPYASPPLGNLRFMPPVSPVPWRGVKVAATPSPVCPQRVPDIQNETLALQRMTSGRYQFLRRLLPYLKNQSEDCLYLNIYTPISEKRRTNSVPVMVFIHGESYEWNSGNPYDGSVLASYGDVIVVTINFRLGILGFLNSNNLPYQRSITNYGIMDQIASLHWIKENIKTFGGDSENISVFGHGTGAACVNFLMTSKAVLSNLFQRAILMSGSALAPWSLVASPRKYTLQIAKALNCSQEQMGEGLKSCLRKASLDQIMQAEEPKGPEYYFAFGPTVDGVVIGTDLDTDPQSYVSRLANYDLLFGVTPLDALLAFNEEELKDGLDLEKRRKILRTFVRNTYSYHLSEILATAINEYTDWDRPLTHPINTRDETISLLTDALYSAPVLHTGTLHTSQARKSSFYVFDYQTKNGDIDYEGLQIQNAGGAHGEEMAYLWGAPLVDYLPPFSNNYTQLEVKLSEAIVSLWTNFVKTGNPNGERPDKVRSRGVEWPAFDNIKRHYLEIGSKFRPKTNYRSHQLSFWLQLVPQLHQSGRDAPESHHHFDHHDDWNSYRGVVRSQPVTRVILPPESTAEPTTTRQYNVSAVLQSTPNSNDISDSKKAGLHNDFAVYSTALSVTIAIGCSLLLLNILIFAGVYYQRDKSRLHNKKNTENGELLAPSQSVSGDIRGPSTPIGLKADIVSPPMDLIHSSSVAAVEQAHLPPPEFADCPPQCLQYGTTKSSSHTKSCNIKQDNSQQAGKPLMLSSSKVPAPPKVPAVHVSEEQPLLRQNNSKKPINRDSNNSVGELRV